MKTILFILLCLTSQSVFAQVGEFYRGQNADRAKLAADSLLILRLKISTRELAKNTICAGARIRARHGRDGVAERNCDVAIVRLTDANFELEARNAKKSQPDLDQQTTFISVGDSNKTAKAPGEQ